MGMHLRRTTCEGGRWAVAGDTVSQRGPHGQLALHPPLAWSTALTAWMRSRALGSVYSTNTSSSFSAIFTTSRNWDKGRWLGRRQGAASAMPGHCGAAVPTTQGQGFCWQPGGQVMVLWGQGPACSCDGNGQGALGRVPERDPLTESQNHSTLGVGRDLCGSPSPTPCRSRVTQSRLHRTVSRQVLNISREGDTTTSLGSSVPRSTVTSGQGALGTLGDFQMGGSRIQHTQRYQSTKAESGVRPPRRQHRQSPKGSRVLPGFLTACTATGRSRCG